jgi:hypothetical protein
VGIVELDGAPYEPSVVSVPPGTTTEEPPEIVGDVRMVGATEFAEMLHVEQPPGTDWTVPGQVEQVLQSFVMYVTGTV